MGSLLAVTNSREGEEGEEERVEGWRRLINSGK
jgi:hypothetical protein